MATGLWGSLCLNDLLEGAQVAPAPDGSVWLNLNSLPKDRFKKSDKNQKTYVDTAIWINDELDEHNNAATVSFNISKEQREAGVKAKKFGYFKYMAARPPVQQQATAPVGATPWGGTPTAPAGQPTTPWGQAPVATTPVTNDNPWAQPPTGGLPF